MHPVLPPQPSTINLKPILKNFWERFLFGAFGAPVRLPKVLCRMGRWSVVCQLFRQYCRGLCGAIDSKNEVDGRSMVAEVDSISARRHPAGSRRGRRDSGPVVGAPLARRRGVAPTGKRSVEPQGAGARVVRATLTTYNFRMTPSLCLQNEHASLERAEEHPAPRLALTPLDQLAATAFATGAVDQLLEQVRARSEVLCGPDGPGLRLRLIAKRLATCEAQVELLEALVGKALAGRDWDGLHAVEQLLRSFTARLMLLRREHAEELRQRQRPTVVVRREVVSVQEG